ncbi:hypothetical protein ISN44_As04g007230 [Arabidopsis suecica]|uniref:Uncharacterized protein n=1 Tax=Arabidopsis suecica TaxID=45249 RepID=A0A8T2E961_ARASU|nr:hypothetical protein ISN44_As04g007230 [Arabidopsis suecica]
MRNMFSIYFIRLRCDVCTTTGRLQDLCKVVGIEEDPVLLRGEVKRLEGKVQNLTSALEAKKKENVEVSDKLHQCNEQLKEDKVKRWEALQEISTTQHLLKLKSESDSNYKELLAKCNQLGRGVARSSEKLEKALEKIEKLKKRMRELELITEERENRALRDINVSKKCSYQTMAVVMALMISAKRVLVSLKGSRRERLKNCWLSTSM